MALGFMRRHRRWLNISLGLVIAAFIILYIPAFQGAAERGAGATLVEVGSLPITVGEYQKAYLRQREMYQNLYQGRLDPEAIKRLGLEEQTLQALIDDRVLQLEARRLGISVDDDTVRARLATSPEYQVDGHFMGGEELRRRLEMQGVSVGEFEQDLRNRILRERVASLVTDGVMVSPREAEDEFRQMCLEFPQFGYDVLSKFLRLYMWTGLTVVARVLDEKLKREKNDKMHPSNTHTRADTPSSRASRSACRPTYATAAGG